MGFIYNMRTNGIMPPSKIYFHDSYKDVLYHEKIEELKESFLGVLNDDRKLFCKIDFTIALMWQKILDGKDAGPEDRLDIFRFYDIGDWPGNPTIDVVCFNNGEYVQDCHEFCGDGLIIASKEEEMRRGTKDIEEFITQFPFESVEDLLKSK